MLSIRPSHRAHEFRRRARACSRPARRIARPLARIAASIAASCAARSMPLCASAKVAMPSASAIAQPARIGIVAGDQHDLVRAVRHAAGVEQRRHVGAAPEMSTATRAVLEAGSGGCVASHASRADHVSADRAPCSRAGPRSTSPMRLTLSPRLRARRRPRARSSGATASTMPMPQLKVRAISPGSIVPCAWRNAISRGCSQASASITRVRALRAARGGCFRAARRR